MQNESGKYKKVLINKVFREPVSEVDVATIKAAIIGYGNLKVVAGTAQVSTETIKNIVKDKAATPEMLKTVLGAIEFINANKATA